MSAPKAQMFKEGAVLDYTAAAAKLGGDVVKTDCGLCGVLVDDVAINLVGSAQVTGLFKVEKAQVTIAAGEDIFFDNDGNPYGGTAGSGAATNVASAGDVWMGKAQAAAASTAKHVYVVLNQHEAVAPARTRTIFIDGDRQDCYTADGSEARPYKTLAAGWAALTATRNIIRLKAGTYQPTAALALPAHDVFVIGEDGNDTVVIEASAANIFSKAAGALTATTTYHFENLMLEHGDTYKGIVIDNTSATKKIIVSIRNCEFGGSANAIDVATHGDADNAVRVVVNNGGMEIEGPVNFTIGNDGDYLRITDAVLSGGLVTGASATVSEITLRNCEVLHEGVTGGNAAQVLNVISCHSRTGATIAAFDTNDAAGSHTENILAV